MKKALRTFVSVIAIVLIVSTVSGCGLVVLNEEKDAQSVVAIINGENILKSEFNDYVTFNTIVYELYDYQITEDIEEAFVSALYQDFVNTYLFKLELEKAGVEITQEEIAESENEFYEMLASYAPDETSLNALYEEYGLDEASFKELVSKEIEFAYYATKYDSSDMDKSFVTEAVAMEVDGVDIPNYIFYYYAVMIQLQNYMYEGTYASTEEEYLELYDEVAVYIQNAQAVIDYCESNGITVTEDEITSARLNLQTVEYYAGSDTMQQMYDGYYLTDAQIEEGETYMATASAYQTKLENQVVSEIAPTEKQLQNYMQDNIDDYDESTVSAYHILVEDETAAKALEDEAGGTAEGFMAVYTKYQDNATIKEMADLGSFKRKEMVDEFSQAAFSMEIGQVRGCVQTEYGYHLIYVYDKNIVEVPAYEQIADTVRQDYIDSVKDEEINKFFEKITNVKVRNKNYSQMPGTLLTETLAEIYNVKTKLRVALR